jgi:ribosomal protein S8
LFFQQKNVVIFPYVDLKHLHSLEIFTAGHSIVDLESTALHDLKGLLEFESTNTYSQLPSLYFIYNLDKSKVKEVMSLDNIRCVLNASENVSELVNGNTFIFYNKKNNQFLNLDETDLDFEEYLINSSGNKEVLQDIIQKIKVISSRIFAELNQDNFLEQLPQLLKEFDKKYWGKILDFTSSYFDIEIPDITHLQLTEPPQEKVQDYSDEYAILVSTNKNIGKEFIQLLHDYRSKKVNSSHLILEQLFNPVELYNYLRNHHWKEGIPESFVKEWSEMGLSQYQLTETDYIDFESILKKLSIPPVTIKYNEKNKLKIKEVKKVSRSIKKSFESRSIPSVRDFPTFKAWVFETFDEIETKLGIQSVSSSSNMKNLVKTSFPNSTKNLKKVIVDLTNILMADLDKNRNMQTQNVLLIKDQIISEEFNPILVTDAKTLHHIDDEDEFRKLVKEGIIRQAPADRKADIFVLKLARKQNCKFITNDKYSDPQYREEFGKEWIRENRITFIFTDGVLVLD